MWVLMDTVNPSFGRPAACLHLVMQELGRICTVDCCIPPATAIQPRQRNTFCTNCAKSCGTVCLWEILHHPPLAGSEVCVWPGDDTLRTVRPHCGSLVTQGLLAYLESCIPLLAVPDAQLQVQGRGRCAAVCCAVLGRSKALRDTQPGTASKQQRL